MEGRSPSSTAPSSGARRRVAPCFVGCGAGPGDGHVRDGGARRAGRHGHGPAGPLPFVTTTALLGDLPRAGVDDLVAAVGPEWDRTSRWSSCGSSAAHSRGGPPEPARGRRSRARSADRARKSSRGRGDRGDRAEHTSNPSTRPSTPTTSATTRTSSWNRPTQAASSTPTPGRGCDRSRASTTPTTSSRATTTSHPPESSTTHRKRTPGRSQPPGFEPDSGGQVPASQRRLRLPPRNARARTRGRVHPPPRDRHADGA